MIRANGRTTIPKRIRDHLGLKPGDRVKFFIHPSGGAVMRPVLPVSALKGSVKYEGLSVTTDEMEQAIGDGVTARYHRSRSPPSSSRKR